MVQFDGRFAHGCSTCHPKLKRYADNKTDEELCQKTWARDRIIKQWILQQNNKATTTGLIYKYIVITDCHTVNYSPSNLQKQFETVPELYKLRQPYVKLFRHSIGLQDILNADPNLTYILIGSGRCPRSTATSPPHHVQDCPMMVWKKHAETGQAFQDFDWNPTGPALYTRDTLEFAQKQFNFKLDHVTCVYFYSADYVLPTVFEDLVKSRTMCDVAQQKSKSKFIKSLINYSTGMFGFNPHKKQTNKTALARIVKSLPYRAQLGQYSINYAGEIEEDGYFVIQKINAHPSYVAPRKFTKQKILNAALPLYACVAEYGKMRLNSCFRFILESCVPGTVRCAYSQVDNLVLVLAKPNLEDLIVPSKKFFFQQEKDNYFTPEDNSIGNPGQLQKEWIVSATKDGPWQFVSPRPCTYAIALNHPEDKEQCRMSSLSNVSTKQAYNACTRMLDRQPVIFVQERRLNRLVNTETKQMSITFAVK